MVVRLHDVEVEPSPGDSFAGLRLSADEFFDLPDDPHRYELLDGVVIMSPSPTPSHQDIALEIALQIRNFARGRRIGKVFAETDVLLGKNATGGDIVYRPDVIFIAAERVSAMRDRIVGAPDLVVEVVSPESRRLDTITKRGDYERFGVREYWIMDPQREAMTFLRLKDGAFVEVAPSGDTFASEVVPAFVLDLAAVREAFKAW